MLKKEESGEVKIFTFEINECGEKCPYYQVRMEGRDCKEISISCKCILKDFPLKKEIITLKNEKKYDIERYTYFEGNFPKFCKEVNNEN